MRRRTANQKPASGKDCSSSLSIALMFRLQDRKPCETLRYLNVSNNDLPYK
jgi:hypothetical protein